MKKLILVAVPVVLGIAAFLICKFSAMNDPPAEAETVTVTPKLVGSTGRIMQDADIFAGLEEPDEFNRENAGYLQAVADTMDISVSSETADEVVLLLRYYDADKVLEEAQADKGFSSDLRNFNSIGIDEDSIQTYLMDYVKSLLGSGELQKEQKTLSVKKLDSKLETNKFILEYLSLIHI